MSGNDQLYRRIVNAVPEGIWIVSPEGRTIFCNGRMAELLGTDVESLEKLSCFDPVFPEDLEEAQRQFGLQMSGGGQPFDFRLRRMDGSAIWVSISCKPMYDDGGICTGLLGLFTNISERRRTESDLKDSEKLFRAIFSQAAVGIAQTSLTGDWLVVNDRLCEILGYTQGELRARTFLEVTHPDDRDASLTVVRQLLSGEISSWLTEKRYIRKSGTVVWGRLFVSLVRDGSNQPQYFIAVVEEVTDRIQAERALQESQQQLRLALSTGLGVWDCDLRSAAVRLSPQYRNVFGYGPLSFGEWMKLIHPDDRERVVSLAKQGVERTHEWEAEFRVLWPDGTIRWMISKGNVILDEERRPARMVGISVDVTERRRAEEQRLRLAAIVESSDAAIVGETVDGIIVSWNRGAEKLYGYKAEEVVGQHISMLVPSERQDRIESVLESLRRGERIEHFETTRVRKDGQLVLVSLTVSPIADSSGAVVGISAIGRDITEQKRAEGTLRESEERFRNMADSAPVMIWVSDTDKLGTFFNKPWLDFTGRTMEQELGNGWADDVHPEDLDRCLATYTSSFDARQPFKMEYRLRRADGEYRWILENATPLYRGSEFAGYIGSCVDMTEQKLIEERLRYSEARLVGAQRLVKVGSWEQDIETKSIYWSDEIFRVFGLPQDKPIDLSTFLSCVHPKDRQKIFENDHRVRAGNAPVDVEYRIIRPDGEVRFIRSIVEPIRNGLGALVRLAGATQDITEQVKAEDRLRQSEERLRYAERLAHVGHWHWDLNSGQVSWSEEMFHIFGQPPDCTPSYEGFFQAFIAQDRERISRELRDALADHSGFSSEVQIARPNGDLRTIAFIAEVLLDDEGLLMGVFGATQDITDLRRAQRADFARQKLESIGTLASGIAHDFNNLLGSVLVQAEVALKGLASGSNPEEELKTIREVALRGSEIVRELMVYAGKESAAVELVDVSKIAKEMLELLRVSVSKHTMLEADLGKNLPSVRANAAQLRQVVMNLVTNASDALGDRDGMIRLSTRCVRVDQVSEPDLLDERDYTLLEVSDTGCGMTPEMQAKVFDPFFTTKSAGHGLGLAIVDGIVRSLRGRIRLISELGKGTTFQILLPCAGTRAEGDGQTISAIEDFGRPFRHATVLIVEDEGPLRQAVTKMLRNSGFDVFEAADGSSAIDVLRASASNIDLILLDMTIPGAPSPEVVAEAAKFRPDIKVVLTSAYSQEMIAGAMKAPQVRSFIRKPFQLGDLVKTLENVFSEG